MAVKHSKNLAGASNGNSAQVQPADWNGDHTLTGLLAQLDALVSGLADKVLCFDGSGNVQLLPKSSILTAVSPGLTGTPTAPTASLATNSDQIATTAFVQGKVAALIASAPGLLDTLDEIAAALGDDPNFAATMTTALALKAPLASPALTGNPTTPNQTAASNNTRIANTAYADAAVAALSALIVAGTTAVPGAIVGSSLTTTALFTTLTTRVPNDDTIPTNTEGDQILTANYTPKSTTNKLRCTFRGQVASASLGNAAASIFQGSTNIGAAMVTIGVANGKATFHLVAEYTPGTIAAQTISVRAGGDTADIAFNGIPGTRIFGGLQTASLLIEEIKN